MFETNCKLNALYYVVGRSKMKIGYWLVLVFMEHTNTTYIRFVWCA